MGGPDVKRGGGRNTSAADSAFAASDRGPVRDGDNDGYDLQHSDAGECARQYLCVKARGCHCVRISTTICTYGPHRYVRTMRNQNQQYSADVARRLMAAPRLMRRCAWRLPWEAAVRCWHVSNVLVEELLSGLWQASGMSLRTATGSEVKPPHATGGALKSRGPQLRLA